MAFEKVNRGAQQSTLTGLVVIMLLAIGIFGGMFLFMQEKMINNGENIPTKYNDTYANLVESQTDIDENVNNLQTAIENVNEADDVFQVAWNGLKGLGAALKLPAQFISNVFLITASLIGSLDVIPPFYKGLALTGIIAGVVFLVYSILKGDPRM